MLKPDSQSMKLVVPVALGVTLGMLAISLVWTLGRGIVRIESVLWPLALALLIAYIFDPVVDWMTRRLRMSRLIATGLLFIVGYAVLVLLLLWLVPQLVAQVADFVSRVPELAQRGYEWVSTHLAEQGATSQPTTAQDGGTWAQVSGLLQTHSSTLAGYAQTVLNQAGAALGTLFYGLTLLVLMPLYTFVFLWRFDHIRGRLAGWVPDAHRPRVLEVAGKMNTAVASFFRGQLIVCVAVGVLTAIAWTTIGLNFGLLLGLLVGVLNLVPFMGMLVGLPIACAVALLGSGQPYEPLTMLILTVACFTIIQALENFLLTPYVQGKAVGLHPVTIVVVLMIGSAWLGVLGMLLAVPVTAAIKVMWGEWLGPKTRAWLGAHPPPESGGPPAQEKKTESPEAGETSEPKDNEQKSQEEATKGKSRRSRRRRKGR